jgi:hypothetical protein
MTMNACESLSRQIGETEREAAAVVALWRRRRSLISLGGGWDGSSGPSEMLLRCRAAPKKGDEEQASRFYVSPCLMS